MKKYLAFFLAMVIALSMVACGTNDASTAPSTTVNNTEPTVAPTEPTVAPTVAPTDPTEPSQPSEPTVPDDQASFTVIVTDENGTSSTFTYTSDADTVGQALLNNGLIDGYESTYGLYVTTVNGITADWDTENAYWAFYINGEYAMTGVDATEITNGATYSFVKTVSYTVKGEGDTRFYFTARNEDSTVTRFEIHTNETTVGAALLALDLIDGYESSYGLYVTTVNGITADWDTENAYWAFFIDGEYATTGVDATEITPDATYEMFKTVEYTVKGEGVNLFYFTVKNVDGTVTKFKIFTNESTVGAALLNNGLIDGYESTYGLYVTTVNGITADWDTENAYWAFYINGEYAMTGVDTTEIISEATYEMVKTVSYTVKGEGDTRFYFTVKNVDGTVTRFEIHTNETTVGAALLALDLIDGYESTYGLYVTTVNGITADWDTENAYWAFYINGEYAMTGVDATKITPDATYEMVKTVS